MSDSPPPAAWSLRKRLTKGLVLTALLPMVLFATSLLLGEWQRSRHELLLRLDANATLSASVIDDFLEGQLAGVRLLADQMGDDPALQGEELARLLHIYPSMLRIQQVNARGDVVAVRDARDREVPLLPGVAADEEWFVAARSQYRAFVSGVTRRPAYGNEAVVGVSAPLLHDGRFAGALQADVPVQAFVRLNAESLARRKLELLLLDRGNNVVHAGKALRWKALDAAGARGQEIRRIATQAGRATRVVSMGGLLREGGVAYVEAVVMRNGWTLALVTPHSQLLAPLLPRLLLLAALSAVSLMGVAWALWLQRRLLEKSIGYLLGSLHGYALGGRMVPARTDAIPVELRPLADGIGELGTRMNAAFDEVQAVLEAREHEIAERTASLREAVSELDRLSRTDAMTGCLNYRGFAEAGERLFREARASGTPLSVLALDIDHFKRYNDLYGHAEGDGALRRFAGAVRSALLHADDVLARPGGEEFTVFLPATDHAQALQVGGRVCQRVRDADIAHMGSPKGRLTASIGVATLQPGDTDPEDMLRRADAALYRVKAAGRDGAGA
ncbi:sensor domain-containing diguanylate cyclase [Thermomonas fusca]|uniref:diguanylate cyclase n=1 Tax=Thermomonas fusca TaxID=215690 RepID=A0A5R9PKG6_9GAMM|nr:sensor domain-containing diguanylate cyclase [Thermomonas fusca]TLX23090.1 GGDEF domain-containing protein [Thermomonas fusca]